MKMVWTAGRHTEGSSVETREAAGVASPMRLLRQGPVLSLHLFIYLLFLNQLLEEKLSMWLVLEF